MYLLKSCFVSLISLRYGQTVQYGGNVVCSKRIPLLFDLLEPGICLIYKAHPADVGSGQVGFNVAENRSAVFKESTLKYCVLFLV